MKIDKAAISLNIAKYRIKANISQKELSQRTGLNTNYISKLENNTGLLPSMNALCAIAEALNVDVDQILFENLCCYQSYQKDSELLKEISFLPMPELEFILSLLKAYRKHIK